MARYSPIQCLIFSQASVEGPSSSCSSSGDAPPRLLPLAPVEVEEAVILDHILDPKPGPSTTAADFDLEVFDSGSSCSLEDCWATAPPISPAAAAAKKKDSKAPAKGKGASSSSSSKRSRRGGKVSPSSSSSAKAPRRRRLRSSFGISEKSDKEEEEEESEGTDLGSPIPGPSGLQKNKAQQEQHQKSKLSSQDSVEEEEEEESAVVELPPVEVPPESACPSEEEEEEEEDRCEREDMEEADRAAREDGGGGADNDASLSTASGAAGSGSGSASAAAASSNPEEPGPSCSTSTLQHHQQQQQENIDEIVQDHDNFGTDENEEDSLDSISLGGGAEDSATPNAPNQQQHFLRHEFKLCFSSSTSSNDASTAAATEPTPSEGEGFLQTAGEMEIFDGGATVTVEEQEEVIRTTAMSSEVAETAATAAAALSGKKRKSDTLGADDEDRETSSFGFGVGSEEDATSKKKRFQSDSDPSPSPAKWRHPSSSSQPQQVPPAAASVAGPHHLHHQQVTPEVSSWLDSFGRFSQREALSALDALIFRCAPAQVRHMLAVIEPQFQRDFISHLPKELALYVLSFLGPRDLLRAAQTCRTWRTLCEDNLLWREKCAEADIDGMASLRAVEDMWRQRAHQRAIRRNPAEDPDGLPRTWRRRGAVAADRDARRVGCRQHPDPAAAAAAPPTLDPPPTVTSTSSDGGGFAYSAWKSTFMRQHHVDANWRRRPVRPPRVLKGHDDHVITCLQFDGDRIVSGSDDNTLKVWCALTGKCLRTLVGHTGGVWSSQMMGEYVVSGSTDRTLKVWVADSGECLHTLYGHTSTVRCMHMHGQM